METFENLIPKLHKKHYVKENTTNQTISIYKNNRYSLSATVMLNHDTGQALFIYNFILYRPKDQTEPLTMPQIGEIIETLIESYYEINYIYDNDTYKEEAPINLPLEIAKFQAQLMQQKYKFIED